jgi:O-antigen ligase
LELNPVPFKGYGSAIQIFSAVVNRASSLILYAAMALAPLPLGSTGPATISFWCIVLGVGVMLASLLELRKVQLAFIGLTAVLMVAYAVVLHEQLAAEPWLAAVHPIWREASDLLGTQILPSASIARNQPLFAVGAPLAAMLCFLCSLIICADRIRARQLLKVIAWSGAAYAIYGIALSVFDPVTMTWRSRPVVLTSTFVNRNTAAVYFGACSILWLLLVFERLRRHGPVAKMTWVAMPSGSWWKDLRDVLLPSTMMFVCLVATFMTNSKAGAILSLTSLVVAAGTYFFRDLRGRRSVLLVIAAGGGIALLAFQLLAGSLMVRIGQQGLIDSTRLDIYRSTLRMIADHPWFGTGLGTFALAFPEYRSDQISMFGIYDRAHNTLLEIAAELGLPMAGLIVAGWLIVFGVLVHGIRTRRRERVVPVAAFAVALLAILHSLVDFSLQVPGFAIIVFALVGAGIAQSFRSINSQ